jgi:hypothetical protein
MRKMRQFHHVHKTPPDQVLADLKTAVGQLSLDARTREAGVVAEVLRNEAQRRRGPTPIGAILPAILARLEISTTEDDEPKDRP